MEFRGCWLDAFGVFWGKESGLGCYHVPDIFRFSPFPTVSFHYATVRLQKWPLACNGF